MGFTDTLKAAMDSSRKYQLSREMTIDEVYQILVSAGLDPEEVGSFELKKGLGAKSIVFSGGTIAYPTLTVHGSEARLQKITQEAFLADLDKDVVSFVPNFATTTTFSESIG